ncbi:MAG: HD domain-containing protein [Deltaproteobacteria bacterium]|nr:HD domain-containing protein [Deltaproteobacteria bacterium]
MKDKNDRTGRTDSARSYFKPLKGLERLKADRVIKAASDAMPAGSVLYLVGGVLRNIALGVAAAPDYDFSFDGDTRALAVAVSGILGGSFFALDEEAGAWRVVSKEGGLTIDFTPTAGGDILADLGKRDFTVNALALQVRSFFDGESVVIDPFGGINDAGAAILRKVSYSIFDDDPVRMMRAVRLSIRYGLEIEQATWELLVSKAPLLSKTSPERAREELVQLMTCADSTAGVKLLFASTLMQVMVPEMKEWKDISGYDLLSHSLRALKEADKLLGSISEDTFSGFSDRLKEYFMRPGPVPNAAIFRLAALFHDFGKAYTLTREPGKLRFIGHDSEGAKRLPEVMERLRFSRRNSSELAHLVKNHHRVFMLASLKERTFRAKGHFFRATGGESGLVLLCLALVDARATRGGEDPELYEVVLDMMRFYYGTYIMRKPAPLMTGRQVMEAFKVPEGPVVGDILRKISEGVETGEVRNRKEAAAYIKKWLKEKKGDTG